MYNNAKVYQETLDHLELRRASCLNELAKIEQAIAALRASINVQPVTETVSVIVTHPDEDHTGFAKMSVRRAALILLTDSPIAMSTAEVSYKLTKGGNTKAGKANVSAVLSDMLRSGEIQKKDSGRFLITEKGRTAARFFIAKQQ